jgi:hypothetical protein
MPRLPNSSDRDFSASQSEDDIHADIAELFASQPPEWDDFFADPIVRTRIGTLITEAMNRSTTPQGVHVRRRGASQYDSWYFGCKACKWWKKLVQFLNHIGTSVLDVDMGNARVDIGTVSGRHGLKKDQRHVPIGLDLPAREARAGAVSFTPAISSRLWILSHGRGQIAQPPPTAQVI